MELVNNRFVIITGEPPRVGGASSEIRKALDSHDGSHVAIKLLHADGEDETIRQFFERESRTLRSLTHPHIVRLIEAGWDQVRGRYYLALEWAEHTWSDALAQEGRQGWRDFFSRVGIPLASALAHAHLKNIEHRDIKPSNILITSEASVKLADFGIAKLLDVVAGADGGPTMARFGSGVYTPPEPEALLPFVRDVFSFGVVAITSMAETRPVVHAELLPALERLELPAEVRQVLRACVDTDPRARPLNGAVLEIQLQASLGAAGARVARHTNTVWLKMTQSAASKILEWAAGSPDVAMAEAEVMEDLAEECFAEFRSNRDTGLSDRRRFQLLGQKYRLSVVVDEREPTRLVVVAADRPESDWRDRARNRACSVGQLVSFRFGAHKPVGADRGLDTLVEALDEHQEPAAGPEQDLGDLLAGWRRLLDAKEELARAGRQPLEFTDRQERGRQVDFFLAQATDQMLVGEEWEVFAPKLNRVIGRGDVVDQGHEQLTLRFRHDIRDVPPTGRLLPYLGPDKAALSRQREALQRVSARESANPQLHRAIAEPSELPSGASAEIGSWFRKELDDSKRAVVRSALGSSELLLVEGPPGTGKTTVIAEIVQQVLRRDPRTRILLVSQTHIAIDNALQHLEEAGVTGTVRLGRRDDPRISEQAHPLLLERQIKSWVAGIRSNAQRHIAALAASHGLEERHLRAAAIMQELAAVLGDIQHVQSRAAELATQRTGASPLNDDADDAVAARGRLAELIEERDELLEQARRHLAGDLTLGSDPTAADIRHGVEAVVGGSVTSEHLMQLLELQTEWLHRIESDRGMIEAFLRTRTVVAGTAIGFLAQRAVGNLDFDLCIFDEASKATATETLVPLSRARRAILVGDTRQLPPLVEDLLRDNQLMEQYQLSEPLVTTTLFQHLADHLPETAKHLLREQYRMIPPIGNLISACFYDNRLVSPRTGALPGYDKFGKPVLWIDTAPLGSARFEQPGGDSGTSYSNRAEAQQVIKRLQILDAAVGHNLIQPSGGRLEVLLIAPYSQQVEELRRRLATLSPTHLDVLALSVDSVQGRECDLAIFTVTRSNPHGRLGFLGDKHWRRINVALSRARYGLTIIGDAGGCQKTTGALNNVLTYIRTHGDDCEIRDADRP
ncbi:hypothetical protein Misp01_38520 [Microtetraspora sp. NBRC 13810]|nr:hypothetical protein Misp01_38520 [Microtetraspora sp. NBRC 13810]